MSTILILCFWGTTSVFSGGAGFSWELLEEVGGETMIPIANEGKGLVQKQESAKEKKPDTEDSLPTLPPPAHDPEMVIEPDVPPDPDAVVVPPPIDPEMSVDPATREPMTRKKLENLQEKDSAGKGNPGHEEKSIPEK